MSRTLTPRHIRRYPTGRWLMTAPLALLLAGCVTSDVVLQPPETPAAFAAAAPARAATGLWWRSFRDAKLDELVTRGLARNLSITEAVAMVDELEAAASLTRAADLPGLEARAGLSRGNPEGTGVVQSRSATLSTSWMLDIFGGNRAARQAALADLEAAKLSAMVARHTVASSIAASYIDLRFYQESIALTRQSITSRRETLALTRSMEEIGQANRLTVLQAEQAVAQAEASLPVLEIGFDRALNRLATLTDARSSELRPGLQRGAAQPAARLRPSVGVPADVLRARPDVQMAERNFAAATARIGVAEAAFWPSVSLTGSVTPTAIRRGGNLTTWGFGPQINLPIFTAGANQARLSAAEARAVQAGTRWRAAVLTAVEEVENGLASWNRGGRNVAAQRALVSAAQETVTLSRESYRSGQTDFFSVLDAERNLVAARSALAAALRDQATGYVALSIAAGLPVQ